MWVHHQSYIITYVAKALARATENGPRRILGAAAILPRIGAAGDHPQLPAIGPCLVGIFSGGGRPRTIAVRYAALPPRRLIQTSRWIQTLMIKPKPAKTVSIAVPP